MELNSVYEIGTQWKDPMGTNADGKIRRFDTLEEALKELQSIYLDYLNDDECTGMFIDRWEEVYDCGNGDVDYDPVESIFAMDFVAIRGIK